MAVFTGRYDRSIDDKNRIQLPSQLRNAIDWEREGPGLYVILGDHEGTLSIYTERGFEALASRIETEFETDDEAMRFELQFYSLASRVDVDKQGRFVLPDQLVTKAGLREEVCLVGQKTRIDVWNREDLDRALGLDAEQWPKWHGYLRRRPRTMPEP